MNDEQRLVELELQARHARDRFRLYRASMHGPTATRPGRLRELQRESELADRVLARFRAE